MDIMGENDVGRTVPISVELVPDSSTDPSASRIPGAVAAAGIAPAAVAAFFAADDGARSVYNAPAVRLRPTWELRFRSPKWTVPSRSRLAVQTAGASRPAVGTGQKPTPV
jgi:hypothetical protein